jgi:hypothetical protein
MRNPLKFLKGDFWPIKITMRNPLKFLKEDFWPTKITMQKSVEIFNHSNFRSSPKRSRKTAWPRRKSQQLFDSKICCTQCVINSTRLLDAIFISVGYSK